MPSKRGSTLSLRRLGRYFPKFWCGYPVSNCVIMTGFYTSVRLLIIHSYIKPSRSLWNKWLLVRDLVWLGFLSYWHDWGDHKLAKLCNVILLYGARILYNTGSQTWIHIGITWWVKKYWNLSPRNFYLLR